MSVITTDITTALATPEPKHVVLNGNTATVYTGEDMPVTTPVRVIRDWEFRDRFTEPELFAINASAHGGDAMTDYVLMQIFTASDGVNLDKPNVITGMDYLVSQGLITLERKAEILA